MDKIINDLNKDAITTISNMSIQQLAKIIKYAADMYYNKQPIIPDQIYDLLVDTLKEKKPDHPVLKQIGAKITTKNKVKLPFYMGSMDKIKPGSSALETWLHKYNGPYIVSDKLDGVSGLFVNDENGVQHLYTRGDGVEGTDVTHLIKYIESLQLNRLPKNIAVRGEFLISKKNFKKNGGTMANARNMVSGLVNSKTIDAKVMKNVDFIVYELVYPANIKQSDQLIQLEVMGFKVVHYDIFDKITQQILSKQLELRRNKSLYEVDGIIITDNHSHIRNITGNPDYAFAYKETLESQIVEATVKEVEWNISKDGLFKPTIIIEPVKLSGVTVKRATAFNAKFVSDNKIGPGAIVKITRSGDVIPHILDVVKPAKEPQMPITAYKWNETKVDIYYDTSVKNVDVEKEMLIKNLTYFFKKLNIKHVDTSTVEKMADVGLDTISKILKANKDAFLLLKGFKEKSAENVYNSIHERIKSVELLDLMVASNIFGHGLGSEKLELVLKTYPGIIDMKLNEKALIEAIIEINGFATLTATRFAEALPKFKEFLKTVPMITITNKYTTQIKKGGVFSDQKIVFTGFRNKTWIDYIEDNGGEVTNTVSKNTTIVVASDPKEDSSKLKKANELGILILGMDEFKKKYKL